MRPETPSQTAGPYLHIGLTPGREGLPQSALGEVMRHAGAHGTPLTLTGRIVDGAGDPVGDAVIEAWQADARGRLSHEAGADPAFAGFGRAATDAEGRYTFETVHPGPVPFRDGAPQAPHISLWILARGINVGLHTRAYFAEDADAHATDPLLARVTPSRRPTLIARPEGGVHVLDIHLQGPLETVFLDI